MEKTFTVVPRGVALVIGCNTFPTWNSWPGLFASLVTGNPVVVKPHPAAVLPLAITVQVCQEVLAEAGFDPNLVTLAAEDPADRLAASAGGAARGEADRLHRRQRVRRVARGQRPAGGRVHREGRRQHRRRRLDRRLRGDVPEPRVLVLALHRPDVHRAAERLPAGRRDRDRRGREVAGRGGGRDRRRARQAARRRRPRGRAARRRRQRRRARAARGRALGERRGAGAESRTVTHPAYADATVRTPTMVGLDGDGLRRLRGGVLRPGGLPDLDRRAPTSRSTCSATP